MDATTILALMLSLVPARRARAMPLAPLAAAIASAVEHEGGRPALGAELVAVAFYETTLGLNGIPFGVSALHRRGDGVTAKQAAAEAARILRRGRAVCGPGAGRAVVLGFYHTGRCAADDYSSREARTVARLLRHADGVVEGSAPARGGVVASAP